MEMGAGTGLSVELRPMESSDSEAVLAIYGQGIEGLMATFETSPPDWAEWNEGHLTACRLVAISAGEVVGFAALSPVSRRECYRGVAEVMVYVRDDARGKSVGRALLQRLVEDAEAEGFWTLQASMFPENEATVRLHESCGFRLVGRRERIARQRGVWRDTVIMERRSGVDGIGE